MSLYSDAADPDTGSQRNPDAGLHVEFYDRSCPMPDGSKREEVYCIIQAPGDKNLRHDQPVRQSDKERFPRHWLAYTMSKSAVDAPVYGTPLKKWHEDDPTGFNENQLMELTALRFQTIEQIAGANDMQIQRMGLGAAGLKIRAQEKLAQMNRSSESRKIADLEAQMADLMAKLAAGGGAGAAGSGGAGAAGTVSYGVGQIGASGGGGVPQQTPAQERMAKARAARKVNRGELDAPGADHAGHG